MSQRLTRRELLYGAAIAGAAIGVGQRDAGVAAPCVPASANDPLAAFHDYAEKAMTNWKVPGLAVALVKGGKTILARGYGLRKLGRNARVDEHTVFPIASCTKAFTAACVALLVDDGKLTWDDPVLSHLPGFQLSDPRVTRAVTLRDLLCHRTGLPRADLLWRNPAHTRDEIVRRLRYLKPTSRLRSRYGYNNIMYLVVGQVVARVSGESWDEFVEKCILRPLGMRSSSTSMAAVQNATNAASAHATIAGAVQPIPWHNRDNIGPAGSINSTVADLAEWVKLHLALGASADGRLLNAETMREMHTPQIVIPSRRDPKSPFVQPQFTSYGLGWFINDYRGHTLVEHAGTTNGMVARIWMMPALELGLIILSNRHETWLNYALMFTVFDAYLGEPAKDWSTVALAEFTKYETEIAMFKKRHEERRINGTRPTLAPTEYAGTYGSDVYGKLEITEDRGRLNLRYGPRFTGELSHWHHDTFCVSFDDPMLDEWSITFDLESGREVTAMRVQEAPAAPPWMEAEDLGTFRRL